jgi:hypothetical protein
MRGCPIALVSNVCRSLCTTSVKALRRLREYLAELPYSFARRTPDSEEGF